jgi:hypothetical protein
MLQAEFSEEMRSICGVVLGIISMRLATRPTPSSRMKISGAAGSAYFNGI